MATVAAARETLAVRLRATRCSRSARLARSLPIPGLAEHGLGFKDLADAIHLRNHVLRQLEAAAAERDRQRAEAHLTFVFVGAGYAGVEALAELSDLVRDALRYYPELRAPAARWVLVDAAPKILPEIPTRLGDYAAQQLARRGVEIRTSTTLDSVGAGRGRALGRRCGSPTHTLVWTAGVRPNPVLARARRRRSTTAGRVLGRRRRSESRATTASGRSATAPRVPNERDARPARPAHLPARAAPGPPPRQEPARRRRSRTATGCSARWRRSAATRGSPLVFGLPLRGFLGWFVTRTYHLYQLPLLSRKLRVVADWTVALFFRRDIAELGMLGHPRKLGDE